ncbi:MAG: p-hydroxycinnamoyl-CoA synthetase, partial [Verrucomicrobiales bacterium]|nr:p-hydroxycinnamoyl-CoA synthetase [Verrucomicrobiales bacterium]
DAAIDEESLRNHCRRRLAAFQVPELLRILPRLPHTSQGKIHKAELRRVAASLSTPT